MAKVLIVDDEPGMRRILTVNLHRDSHVVVEAAGAAEAVALIGREEFDVVVTDHKMPDGSGLDVLHAVQEDDPTTSVIFLTAVGTLELAVESMRQGAFDFITKPFIPDVVRAAIRRASQHTALLRENAVLKKEMRKLEGADEILGNCPEIRAVRDIVARVAGTNSTVLITGETGTGKELVARAIHRNSLRAHKPFIAINCAALSPKLFSRANCSAMSAGRLRAPTRRAAAYLKPRMKARCFSMRWRRCPRPRRPSFCACLPPERSREWARRQLAKWMYGFWRQRIAISRNASARDYFAKTFTIASRWFLYICLRCEIAATTWRSCARASACALQKR